MAKTWHRQWTWDPQRQANENDLDSEGLMNHFAGFYKNIRNFYLRERFSWEAALQWIIGTAGIGGRKYKDLWRLSEQWGQCPSESCAEQIKMPSCLPWLAGLVRGEYERARDNEHRKGSDCDGGQQRFSTSNTLRLRCQGSFQMTLAMKQKLKLKATQEGNEDFGMISCLNMF